MKKIKRHDQEIAKRKKNRQATTILWKPIGGFLFLTSLGAAAAMGRESFASEPFKLSSLDPYGVTLFAIPLIAVVLVAQCVIGIVFARAVAPSGNGWSVRVPTLFPKLEGSSVQGVAAFISLLAFFFVPFVVLVRAIFKFFAGSYYYATVAANGCDPLSHTLCDKMGNWGSHFCPKHGLHFADLFNTPYRYEGNLTYIPILFPGLSVALVIMATAFLCGYLWILFVRKESA